MDPRPPCSARHLGGTALVAVAALLVAMSAGIALAHSDDGVMEITRFEQIRPGTVELEVGIVYANDDHQAEDASVTATMTGADGTTIGPVELLPASGIGSLYAASIPLPAGTWTARIESTNPDAIATGSLEVENAPADNSTTIAPSTAESTTTVSPVAPEEPAAVVGETATAEESDDGGGSTGLLVAAAVVAVSVIGGGAYLASRRRGGAGDTIE